ncbi:hypothetical protein PHYBOEH_012011 [Phytophthora boehmeriae]|uniref:Phosphatidate cytidylyltransferase n=1 Tax=Phytophthora boehmeriae TaxID=109152 RepID=A0A8T1WUR5_9STRA|nr:hypothetical protein PHYBOEH_012011 [Phytophthora boehmeriae]
MVQWGRRALTALVGIPTALWLLSSDLGMLLLASTLCCLSLMEFTATICPQIVPESKAPVEKFVHRFLVVASGALLCVSAWSGEKLVHDAVVFLMTVCIFVFHIATTKNMGQTALLRLLLDLFALLYIVIGFSHAVLLRYSSSKYGLGLQILGLCCAWVCDSGALLAGSFMGQAKLAPVVSPGKTLVGAVAGVVSSVFSVLAMFALPQLFSAVPIGDHWMQGLLPPLSMMPIARQVILGVLLGILCILGDLVESYAKRVAGVKDSGTFFPGHGGCLDRMDSFLFVAPFLYYYSRFMLS